MQDRVKISFKSAVVGSKIASVSEPELVILAGVSMWSLVLVSE